MSYYKRGEKAKLLNENRCMKNMIQFIAMLMKNKIVKRSDVSKKLKVSGNTVNTLVKRLSNSGINVRRMVVYEPRRKNPITIYYLR